MGWMTPSVVKMIGLLKLRPAALAWKMLPAFVENVKLPVDRAEFALTANVPSCKSVPPE